MRSLSTVIDSIVAIAPDLEQHLSSVRTSSTFAAPEMQYIWWNKAAMILTNYASDHPKSNEIAAIFGGDASGK